MKGLFSPEHQQNIFNRFYKDPTSEEGSSGLGIGLYITSQIIERHEGAIDIESEKGEGSTFAFTLPVEGVKSER